MRIAEPGVIRFLNATGSWGLSPRNASSSVSLSPHPNLNAIDALLLLNMKALCALRVTSVTLNAAVTPSVNSLRVEAVQQ